MTPARDAARVIDELAAALAAERAALLGHELAAVEAATAAKRRLAEEAARLEPSRLDAALAGPIAALAAQNRANGELLAQRQRQLDWALRRLGRIDHPSGYTARGTVAQQHLARSIGRG